MTIVRRESSAQNAARFIALRRKRKKRSQATKAVVGKSARSPSLSRADPIAPLPPKPVILETNAERLRRYRAAAVARGLCYSCRARPAKPGARYCTDCLARTREHQASIAYKRCQSCCVELRGRKALLCVDCTAKDTARFRRVYDARIADGMCGVCGRHPRLENRARCLDCLESLRLRILASNREAGSKPKQCPTCRELGINGTGHNRRTHDRWMERRKAWAP